MTDHLDLSLNSLDIAVLRLIEECHDIETFKIVLAVSLLGPNQLPVDELRLLEFEPLLRNFRKVEDPSSSFESVRNSIEKAIAAGYLVRTRNANGNTQLKLSIRDENNGTDQRLSDLNANSGNERAMHSRPNVFELYEQQIGLITPIIADKIVEAIQRHSEAGVEEAIKIAVSTNHRHWRYIEVTLENRAVEGQRVETNQRDHEENLNSEKYLRGKYSSLFRKR